MDKQINVGCYLGMYLSYKHTHGSSVLYYVIGVGVRGGVGGRGARDDCLPTFNFKDGGGGGEGGGIAPHI